MDKSSVDNDYIQNAVDKHIRMILRIAYQNLKNQADAEDIAQEVFLKLMHQPAFTDEGYQKAWLIRVTINLCKNHRKSAWNRKTTALVDAQDQWEPFSQSQMSIMDEIWSLSQDERNVIYLYYYEMYTVPEIAEILNKKKNTIGSRLGRARTKLKGLILEGGYQHV